MTKLPPEIKRCVICRARIHSYEESGYPAQEQEYRTKVIDECLLNILQYYPFDITAGECRNEIMSRLQSLKSK